MPISRNAPLIVIGTVVGLVAALFAGAVPAEALYRAEAPARSARTVTVTSSYVAPSGADRAGAGSSALPYHTIRYALSQVRSGGTVRVAAGSYAPFMITKPNVRVIGESRSKVVVRGSRAARGVITLAAAGDRVSNLTVTGCRPNPRPRGSFEYSGSASVLVRSTAPNSVVSNLTITRGVGTNRYGLRFGCFGVYVAKGNGVVVSGNRISGQGEGVFLFRGGKNVKILSNTLHDNNAEIRNTPVRNDDFGGTGIGLFETAGRPGVFVKGNKIYNNYAPSHDYGTDGGGFDLFQASDVIIASNIIYNNENVAETGTGTRSHSCANNVFTGNSVSGRSRGSKLKRSVGMILRCARNMRITKNRFSRLDSYTFDIEQHGTWAGGLLGLAISGNRIAQNHDQVFALLVNPRRVGMTINGNRYSYAGTLGLDWKGSRSATLSRWRAATGMDGRSSVVSAG